MSYELENLNFTVSGGENEDDVSNNVYFLNAELNRWEHKEELIAGVTELTIHSSYAVMDLEVDTD